MVSKIMVLPQAGEILFSSSVKDLTAARMSFIVATMENNTYSPHCQPFRIVVNGLITDAVL